MKRKMQQFFPVSKLTLDPTLNPGRTVSGTIGTAVPVNVTATDRTDLLMAIVDAGRVHTPLQACELDGANIVTRGNGRMECVQRLLGMSADEIVMTFNVSHAKATELLENIRTVPVEIVSDVTRADALKLVYDQDSKAYTLSGIVRMMWAEMDADPTLTDGQLKQRFFRSLANVLPAGPKKLAEMEAAKTVGERGEILGKWLQGTVSDEIIVAHRVGKCGSVGETVRDLYLAGCLHKDGLTVQTPWTESGRTKVTRSVLAKFRTALKDVSDPADRVRVTAQVWADIVANPPKPKEKKSADDAKDKPSGDGYSPESPRPSDADIRAVMNAMPPSAESVRVALKWTLTGEGLDTLRTMTRPTPPAPSN